MPELCFVKANRALAKPKYSPHGKIDERSVRCDIPLSAYWVWYTR